MPSFYFVNPNDLEAEAWPSLGTLDEVDRLDVARLMYPMNSLSQLVIDIPETRRKYCTRNANIAAETRILQQKRNIVGASKVTLGLEEFPRLHDGQRQKIQFVEGHRVME